jgi:RNA polymerase sigma-32 factor
MTQASAQGILHSSDSTALALGFTGTLGNIDAYISAVNRLPMCRTKKKSISRQD